LDRRLGGPVNQSGCFGEKNKVIRSAVLLNNFLKMFILLPLHVSALVGHLQVEYTTISGSYFTYNGSVIFYY
jgi:hypothetical protein